MRGNDMSLEKFANRLKTLMEAEKISRRALAAQTHLQRKSINNWLDGKYYPKCDGLIALADRFGVNCDYLLGKDENSVAHKCTVEDVPSHFIKILKAYLTENSCTVYSLAKKLEMGQTTVTRWFTEGGMPETATLIKLSQIMNESVDYLLGRE